MRAYVSGCLNERIVSHCRHRGHTFEASGIASAQSGQVCVGSEFMVATGLATKINLDRTGGFHRSRLAPALAIPH